MKINRNIFQSLLLLFLFPLAIGAQNSTEIFRAAGSPHNPKVEISFNRYYTSEGLAALGKKIADAHPNLVKRQSIGKSA
ncbi:MAG: peptidase M14, partial [Flavobacteriaceae bacterium]|nr:peptidase M14 [Flavobacteriaceae bacterium]